MPNRCRTDLVFLVRTAFFGSFQAHFSCAGLHTLERPTQACPPLHTIHLPTGARRARRSSTGCTGSNAFIHVAATRSVRLLAESAQARKSPVRGVMLAHMNMDMDSGPGPGLVTLFFLEWR